MAKRIMVVDDSRVVRAEMEKMLEGSDMEICEFCRSGEEALEKFEKAKPDLVTMDIVMPGMDGMETCKMLRQRFTKDARLEGLQGAFKAIESKREQE